MQFTINDGVQEAGWAPEWVWTFLRREKSLSPTRIQTPDHPDQNLVAILTTLPRLLI
jgi:hypothetical protein